MHLIIFVILITATWSKSSAGPVNTFNYGGHSNYIELPNAYQEPDWSLNATIPPEGRRNPYNLAPQDYGNSLWNGQIHTQIYPIEVTGLLAPLDVIENLADEKHYNPFRWLLIKAFRGLAKVKSSDDLYAWLGLLPYPSADEKGPYSVPFPNGTRPDHRMGLTIIERHKVKGVTFSCATCHSSNLFGKTVWGMTNRFARANEAFYNGKKVFSHVPQFYIRALTNTDRANKKALKELRHNLKFVGVQKPIQLGLDTSLAQVALSLNRREDSEWAEKTSRAAKNPRADWLDENPADSKPLVWWNLKYKTRWLADGSVVSGNPIITNILWNEIGRATDLKTLDAWIDNNAKIIQELTTAVFSSEAPLITDFFSADAIDLAAAQRGEVLFNNSCAKCHGEYQKAWSLPNANQLSAVEQLKTVGVVYKPKKPVFDVGTDPNRYLGMRSLEQLNKLAISKKHGVKIEPQNGYVPPPLVGIWARWPYFHNNSAPTLCDVLNPANKRSKVYLAVEAQDKDRDFDFNCNGYPKVPPKKLAKAPKEYVFDTSRPGMSNRGHDQKILLDEQGGEIFSKQDKIDLIFYLQTL